MTSVLVLNADSKPLNITSFQRGFTLVYKGKADVVEYDENVINTSHRRPLIIRLIRYVYIPFKKVPLSRQTVYRRDGHVCGYVGCDSSLNLTLDHIMPKSRGGLNTWENLVTCCKKCNTSKDDMTPKEAGMKLKVKPYVPTFQQFAMGMKGEKRTKWGNYFK